MNTYLPIHSGKRFTWTGNVGVTEASVLGRNHTGRVWPDSCDTGFIVRSHKTGTDKVFVYHGALSRSQDVSDVYAHVYRSRDGFEVRVLNT